MENKADKAKYDLLKKDLLDKLKKQINELSQKVHNKLFPVNFDSLAKPEEREKFE